MKQILILSMCVLVIACGSSTNERGIASVSNDPKASGSAYIVSDTMPVASPKPPQASSVPVIVAPVTAPPAGSTNVTIPGKPAPATAAPATIPQPATPKPAAADNSADIKKGEALISKSDCLACHKLQDRLVGPSYKEVAAKYPNNEATINQLASKIKKGGSGVWGAIPMSPHPALSDGDAKAMVKYILTVK
jgi:cytochrome c